MSCTLKQFPISFYTETFYTDLFILDKQETQLTISLLVELDFLVVTSVSDLIVTDKGTINKVSQSDRKHERLLKFTEPLIRV